MKPLDGKSFNEKKLIRKITKVAKSAGLLIIYPAVILLYLFKDKKVPLASKSIIAAALAYFIFPADSIPDITPIIGYSDDLGILLVSLSHLIKYVTPEILEKTKKKLAQWFGNIEELEREEQRLIHLIEKKNKEHA